MPRVLTFAATALLLAASAARAQETYPPENGDPMQVQAQPPQTPAARPPTLTVTTRIVVLDVVVTDKHGNLVTRPLSREDFAITEDKVPQTIRSFEPPAAHTPPAGQPPVRSAADLKRIGDAPVTVLVLDELNSRFEDMSYSRQMLTRYLERQPAVLAQPTALLLASNTTFQQLHDYTQDRDALLDTVRHHMPEYPWRMATSGRGGPGAVERMAQTVSALQQIAQSSTGTGGRKNVLWIGNGFPSADLLGMDSRQADAIESAYRRITNRLLAARVTLYTINPAPGTTSTVVVDTVDDLNTSLDENGQDPFGTGRVSFPGLAPATGGVAYAGRNDIENIVAEGINKGQQYYTLSYSPTNKSDAAQQFRSIAVRMRDPNLRATTRAGYYPEAAGDLNPVLDKSLSQKQQRASLQLDLSNALTTAISYNGLDVTAVKVGSLYVLRVAEKGIAWSNPSGSSPEHAEATVAAGWYDSKGKLLGHTAQEQTFTRTTPSHGASYSLPITLPPAATRLRFVVRDASSGNMGTADVTKF